MALATSAPTTAGTLNTSGSPWYNPTRVFTSNNSRAQVTIPANGQSQFLTTGGYSFSGIPANAVLTDINIEIEFYATPNTGVRLYALLYDPTHSYSSAFWMVAPATERLQWFLQPDVLESHWTQSAVSSPNFRVDLFATAADSTTTVYIDQVLVHVSWELPATKVDAPLANLAITPPSVSTVVRGKMPAGPRALSLGAGSARLILDGALAADGSALSLVGGPALLRSDRFVSFTGSALAIRGGGAVVARRVEVPAGGGAVVVTPQAADFVSRRHFSANGSEIQVNPAAATFKVSEALPVGSYERPGDYGCLIRLTPLDAAEGERVDVYASSFGRRDEAEANGKGGYVWEPCLPSRPRVGMTLWNGDFSEAITPSSASIPINLGILRHTYPEVERYFWSGAAVEIYVGKPQDAWPWPVLFKGAVKSYGGTFPMLSLDAEVNLEPFDRDVLTLTYAGTGGIEGGIDLRNQLKPLVMGWAQNVEPVLIDTVNNVYQFSAYGPIEGVATLYERGSDFGPAAGDHASYAALVAAVIPEGSWATCKAQGLVRLGAPAAGVITGDVRGHIVGAATPRRTGAIIRALAAMVEVPSDFVEAATFDALDAAVPYPVNVVFSQDTMLNWARRLALPCNWQAGVSPASKLLVTAPDLSQAPAVTIDAQGRALPQVLESEEIDVQPPYAKTTFGAARSWRVHTPDEIAFYTDVVPTGRYDDTKTYREGNVVNLIDGSEWIYINETPGAGNPPPSWPATENAYWANMTPPSDIVGAQVAIRTAAIRRPRDANNTPREMLIATTDANGVTTISVARHDWDYPNGSEDITRVTGLVTNSLAPGTDYYVYFDDATLADLNPQYRAATTSVAGENSSDQPYRHPLGKITTPAIGEGPTYGGAVPGYGYQVLVEASAQIATNFNARNDQNGRPIVVPIIAGDGTAIDHVVNGNASVDVSFQWSWFGSEFDIDGFEVLLYSSTASAPYTPGSAPDAEQVLIVPPNKRAFIARGISPTQNLTFAVRAFRVVDPNIDIDQVMHSPWVWSTATGEHPYKPETQVAFPGDISLTIGGVSMQDVSEAVLNFNARNDQDASAIPAPIIASNGTAIDHTLNPNASADVSFEWAWSGQNVSIDGWEVAVVSQASSVPYVMGSTPAIEMVYSMPPDRRAFIALGVHPGLHFNFFVRAFRIVDPNISPTGKIVSAWASPGLASERPYRPDANAAFTGNITGTINGVASTSVSAAVSNFNARNDRLATPIAPVTFLTNGAAVDHTLNINGSADLSLEWVWNGSAAEIDGFDVMIYSSTSSSTYTPGSAPAAEVVYRLAPDKRAFIIHGVQPSNYYTFAVRPFRTVDQDVSANGYIYGAWAKPTLSSENPYRPSASTAFTGDIAGTISGLAASSVVAGASAALNGLNADGTIRGSRVGTAAIRNQALVAAGWAEQGSGISTAPNETYTNIIIFNQFCEGKRLVLDVNLNLEVMVTNPVQGQLYKVTIRGVLQSSAGTLLSSATDQSFRWHGPSATGTHFSELRNLSFQYVWNNLAARAYSAGYRTTNPSTNGSYTWPYRYAKLNDLRATE